MKKFLAIIAIASFAVACNSGADKTETKDTAAVVTPDTAAVVTPDTAVKAAIDTAVKAAIDTVKSKM